MLILLSYRPVQLRLLGSVGSTETTTSRHKSWTILSDTFQSVPVTLSFAVNHNSGQLAIVNCPPNPSCNGQGTQPNIDPVHINTDLRVAIHPRFDAYRPHRSFIRVTAFVSSVSVRGTCAPFPLATRSNDDNLVQARFLMSNAFLCCCGPSARRKIISRLRAIHHREIEGSQAK